METASILEWSATGTGIIAAIIVSLNLGVTKTGWGFVIFTVSSVCWIIAALMQGEMALTVQNGVLFVINVIGIYRYLINKGPDKDEKEQAAGSAGGTSTGSLAPAE
jgi:hypothetical protein